MTQMKVTRRILQSLKSFKKVILGLKKLFKQVDGVDKLNNQDAPLDAAVDLRPLNVPAATRILQVEVLRAHLWSLILSF